ncbi:hypothetical protein PENSPDRAFT_751246 [Peniophora sp. CONT]|nr:hypothetical protein PENSPDRAFT_751246 [Peniophora sp. CONT]
MGRSSRPVYIQHHLLSCTTDNPWQSCAERRAVHRCRRFLLYSVHPSACARPLSRINYNCTPSTPLLFFPWSIEHVSVWGYTACINIHRQSAGNAASSYSSFPFTTSSSSRLTHHYEHPLRRCRLCSHSLRCCCPYQHEDCNSVCGIYYLQHCRAERGRAVPALPDRPLHRSHQHHRRRSVYARVLRHRAHNLRPPRRRANSYDSACAERDLI